MTKQNFLKKLSLLIIFIFTALPVLAHSVKHEIDKLIEKADKNANIGIKIVRLKDNKIIYQKNQNSHFNFASSLKTLTVASAIEYSSQVDGLFVHELFNIKDDYYLDILSDPDFSNQDLENAIKSMKNLNINSIKNFFIVNREFKLRSFNPYWIEGDKLYCFGAPVTKVHINKNCLPLSVAPTKAEEKITFNTQFPEIFQIKNEALTIKDNSEKARIQRFVNGSEIKITGTLNESSDKININPVIEDNLLYLKKFIRFYLSKYNIELKDEIKVISEKDLSNSIDTVIVRKGKSYSDLYKKILKKSDNYISDYIFQIITHAGNHDEWFEAGDYLKDFVSKQLEIDLSTASIYDGSGLSRLNMLTPNHMSNILGSIFKKPYFNDFKSYLINREDEESTAKDIFKDFPYKIYIKTGTMKGIYSLVGYLEKDKELYSFVIVANNAMLPKKVYTSLESDILKAIK